MGSTVEALRNSLEETRHCLALVTFLVRNGNPDQEMTKEIDAILDRGRAALLNTEASLRVSEPRD